jgi:hypothetical protein
VMVMVTVMVTVIERKQRSQPHDAEAPRAHTCKRARQTFRCGR